MPTDAIREKAHEGGGLSVCAADTLCLLLDAKGVTLYNRLSDSCIPKP